jgi:polyketide synthase PksM
VVRHRAELIQRLSKWLERGRAPQVYASRGGELEGGGQAGLKRYGQQCMEECAAGLPEAEHLERLGALADLYVQGYELAYATLFAGQGCGRISLPTYPFATTVYWVDPPTAGTAAGAGANDGGTWLHPLLHENTSDFWRQRYTSVFSGKEMQFADHRVQGRRVLPGVAYLEMVHAAVSRSSGLRSFYRDGRETTTAMVMRNVVWMRPVVAAGESTSVSVILTADDTDRIEFRIQSEDMSGPSADADDSLARTHAQGWAILAAHVDDAMPGHARIDLDRLRSQCRRSIAVEDCYAIYSGVGIEYGPAHRGLVAIDVGADASGTFVLAEVALPDCAMPTRAQYALHPSVLDCALQAALALELAAEGIEERSARGPVMPFALEEAIIVQCTPEHAFVQIREVDAGRAQPGQRKLNIDVCDPAGRICVQLRGISSREARRDEGAGRQTSGPAADMDVDADAADTAAADIATLLLPCWDVVQPELQSANIDGLCLLGDAGSATVRNALQERHPSAHVVEIDPDASSADIAERLNALPDLRHLVWIAPASEAMPPGDALLDAQRASALSCFRTIKALLDSGFGDRPLELTVLTTQTCATDDQARIHVAGAGIHGLIGSLAKEYAHWSVRLLDMPADSPWPLDTLLRLPAEGQDGTWAWRDEEWFRQQLLPCELGDDGESEDGEDDALENPGFAYREGGVYVILGGAGGLGEVFSEHLARNYGAHVVWIGRRPCDETIERKIRRIGEVGPAPLYVQADASRREDLERAYAAIKQRHGTINGIVHSAIVLLDKGLASMDEERFCASLEAKVEASVHLAEVFGEEPLDFLLFFSSLQSFARARGQANYAAGCTFKDAFAHMLARSWLCPVKVMNWGYWGSVGIVASEDTQQRMAQLGVASIEPEEGIAALDKLLCSPFTQLAYIKRLRDGAATDSGDATAQVVALPASAPAIDASIFVRHRQVTHDG